MKTRLVGTAVAALLAVLGTALLVTHLRGVEARAEAGERVVSVLVARDAVPEGTAAEELEDAVEVERVPAKLASDGGVASLDQLAGTVATIDLEPGEQLLTSRFADPAELAERGEIDVPSDLQQVTVALEPQRALGGALSPWDTVGVFISLRDGDEDGDPTTHLTLHKVLVTRVQADGGSEAPPEPAPEGDGDPPVDEPTSDPAPPNNSVLVTLATSAGDAERVVFGAEHGTVWLSNEPDEASESGTSIQSKETIHQ